MSDQNLNLPPSDEGLEHLITDEVILVDWNTLFSENGAELREAKRKLDKSQDPNEIIELTERKGKVLVRGLGSGALSLFKRDVLTEREQFEAEFGQQDET